MNRFQTPLVVLAAVMLAVSAAGDEDAPGVRFTSIRASDAARHVKRIAIIPPVVVLRFDVDGRLPSPDRFTIRRAVANELAPGLRELLGKRLEVEPNESVAAALAEEGLKPVDLFQTARGAEEILRDKRKNVCRLAASRPALKTDPLGVTVYHYTPEALGYLAKDDFGLATLSRGINPRLNTEAAAKLRSRLRADAYLVLRIEDLDTKEGLVGIPLQKFKSSWVTVHATLVSAAEYSTLWEAELQGHSSTRERKIPFTQHSRGFNKAEDRLALDGMTKLIPILAARLTESVRP